MMPDADLAAYEGLIFTTAARYAPLLDDDVEDVQQVLRVKVWQALRAFDPGRSTQERKNFVFACVRNRVKDLLKEQSRRNERRGGTEAFIEDEVPDFHEGRYLAASPEEAFASVEDELTLPSTLTEIEVAVVRLLLLDLNQREIATTLKIHRRRVRAAHAAIQEKMADWRPGRSRRELPTAVAA